MVDAERDLLSANGVDVHQLLFDNGSLREGRSLGADLRLAASTVWSESARRQVAAAIERLRPDVVHVHNTFAAASPSVHWAGRAGGPPIVQTLHNYRLVCPVATAFRDGRACTDCVGRAVPWPGVLHSCVRGSRSQSAAVAVMLTTHRVLGTYSRRVDAHIALTDFQRSLLIAGGVSPRRIHVIPNFLAQAPMGSEGQREGVLYAGRLAPEKGLSVLLAAAGKVRGAIRVAGSGPLAPSVAAAATAGSVAFLGELPTTQVREHIARSRALVVPSLWYEGFPMVVIESFAAGTPVIASRIGSLAEIVEDGATGLLVEPGNDVALGRAVRWALDHPGELEAMGKRARRRFQERYSADRHLGALMELYASLRAKTRGSA